jgi:hypothetical protein
MLAGESTASNDGKGSMSWVICDYLSLDIDCSKLYNIRLNICKVKLDQSWSNICNYYEVL